jgi:hypothetical protein
MGYRGRRYTDNAHTADRRHVPTLLVALRHRTIDRSLASTSHSKALMPIRDSASSNLVFVAFSLANMVLLVPNEGGQRLGVEVQPTRRRPTTRPSRIRFAGG